MKPVMCGITMLTGFILMMSCGEAESLFDMVWMGVLGLGLFGSGLYPYMDFSTFKGDY